MVVEGEQSTDDKVHVGPKLLCARRRLDHATVQDRQERHRIVADKLLEFLSEAGRPILLSGLVGIDRYLIECRPPTPPQPRLQRLKPRANVKFGCLPRQFVGFKASFSDFVRHGVRPLPGRRRAKTVDRPVAAYGGLPVEDTVAEVVRQVEDVRYGNRCPVGDRQDGDIAVEAQTRPWLLQCRALQSLASGNRATRPCDLLHGVRGVDPRAARDREAGTVVHADPQPQPFRLGHGERDQAPPLLIAIGHHLVHPVGENAQSSMFGNREDRRARKARIAHGLQIQRDALARHVVALPVPPRPQARLTRRIPEVLLQRRRADRASGQDGQQPDLQRTFRHENPFFPRPHRMTTVVSAPAKA